MSVSPAKEWTPQASVTIRLHTAPGAGSGEGQGPVTQPQQLCPVQGSPPGSLSWAAAVLIWSNTPEMNQNARLTSKRVNSAHIPANARPSPGFTLPHPGCTSGHGPAMPAGPLALSVSPLSHRRGPSSCPRSQNGCGRSGHRVCVSKRKKRWGSKEGACFRGIRVRPRAPADFHVCLVWQKHPEAAPGFKRVWKGQCV